MGRRLGFVGGFDFNVVTTLLGDGSIYTTVTYIAIGVAGAYTGYSHFFGGSE